MNAPVCVEIWSCNVLKQRQTPEKGIFLSHNISKQKKTSTAKKNKTLEILPKNRTKKCHPIKWEKKRARIISIRKIPFWEFNARPKLYAKKLVS